MKLQDQVQFSFPWYNFYRMLKELLICQHKNHELSFQGEI